MISAIRDDLTQPIVGIIVGAALDTCGYKEGREYMKIALLAFILGGLVFMLGQKSKTGKRRRQKKA
jgi:hypothetical protein